MSDHTWLLLAAVRAATGIVLGLLRGRSAKDHLGRGRSLRLLHV